MAENIKIRNKIYEGIESITLPTESGSTATFSLPKPSFKGVRKGTFACLKPKSYYTTSYYVYTNTSYSYAIKKSYRLLNPTTCIQDGFYEVEKITSPTTDWGSNSDWEIGAFTSTGEWWPGGIIHGPNKPNPLSVKFSYPDYIFVKELSTGDYYLYDRSSGGGNSWTYSHSEKFPSGVTLMTYEMGLKIIEAESESDAGTTSSITNVYIYTAHCADSRGAYIQNMYAPIIKIT